jgi:hypothetical protein
MPYNNQISLTDSVDSIGYFKESSKYIYTTVVDYAVLYATDITFYLNQPVGGYITAVLKCSNEGELSAAIKFLGNVRGIKFLPEPEDANRILEDVLRKNEFKASPVQTQTEKQTDKRQDPGMKRALDQFDRVVGREKLLQEIDKPDEQKNKDTDDVDIEVVDAER